MRLGLTFRCFVFLSNNGLFEILSETRALSTWSSLSMYLMYARATTDKMGGHCNNRVQVFVAVEKLLDAYLDTKKLTFPCFVFLFDGELPDTHSETKGPVNIEPSLKKCVEAVASLMSSRTSRSPAVDITVAECRRLPLSRSRSMLTLTRRSSRSPASSSSPTMSFLRSSQRRRTLSTSSRLPRSALRPSQASPSSRTSRLQGAHRSKGKRCRTMLLWTRRGRAMVSSSGCSRHALLRLIPGQVVVLIGCFLVVFVLNATSSHSSSSAPRISQAFLSSRTSRSRAALRSEGGRFRTTLLLTQRGGATA